MPHFHKKDTFGIDTTTRIARILSIIAPNSASIDAERFQPPVIPPLAAFYDYGSTKGLKKIPKRRNSKKTPATDGIPC